MDIVKPLPEVAKTPADTPVDIYHPITKGISTVPYGAWVDLWASLGWELKKN